MHSLGKNSQIVLTWLVCIAFVGMFFSVVVSNILLITLFSFCLINLRPSEILKNLRQDLLTKLAVGFYLLHLLSLIYTNDIQKGLFILEKKSSILLFPILLLPTLQKIEIHKNLFKFLGCIAFLSSFIMIIVAGYKKIFLLNYNAFYFENITPIDYVYYALYFSCGSIILIEVSFEQWLKKKYGTIVIAFMFIYCLGILILIASKTGIIFFTLTSFFVLYKKISNKKVFTTSIIAILMVLFVLFYLNKTTRERFTEMAQHLNVLTQEGPIKDTDITDLNMRLLFWKISITHSWRDNYFLSGVGPGDAQNYLDSLYTLPDYKLYGYVGWDSHNQWVYTYIQLGVFGLLLLAILYLNCFVLAFKKMDLKFISFLLLIFGFSLSESILESNKGIVFFALFITLFIGVRGEMNLDGSCAK